MFIFFATLWLGVMGARAQVDNCDVNGDGEVNISDVIYVVEHILGQGHASTPTVVTGEAIDLGLPSKTKWASCNVGATKPEEYGGYYAWGETEEKEVYYLSTYIHWDGSSSTFRNLGSDISGTDYDVAHVKWGGDWVMPTWDDFQELLDNCTSEWTTLNGVNGRKFTGPNGNSIFLPATGYRWRSDLFNAGLESHYWSSTPDWIDVDIAYNLYCLSGNAFLDVHSIRCYGFSVRPVIRN